MRFKKGHKTWNKGTKGVMNPNKTSFEKGHKPTHGFKKGFKPWNKGLRGEEYKKHYPNGLKGFSKDRPIKYWLGKKHTDVTKNKISESRKGKTAMENHPNWKGGEITRRVGHEWKLIRKEVLIKYDFQCLHCGQTESLDIHHKIPYRIVKEHKIDNLIPLCKSCHKKEEWRID